MVGASMSIEYEFAHIGFLPDVCFVHEVCEASGIGS